MTDEKDTYDDNVEEIEDDGFVLEGYNGSDSSPESEKSEDSSD